MPNSHYAVSKAAAAQFIAYAGLTRTFPIVNLRLYSAYGPLEDTSRLMPDRREQGPCPPTPALRRARHLARLRLCRRYLHRLHTGRGRMNPAHIRPVLQHRLRHQDDDRELAEMAKDVFDITDPPSFGTIDGRAWDLVDWYAAPARRAASSAGGPQTSLTEGLRRMADWVQSIGESGLEALSKSTASRSAAACGDRCLLQGCAGHPRSCTSALRRPSADRGRIRDYLRQRRKPR